jgi:exopolyphosphatase/guanosine-5'-triphosphate,3'-diphosphate pyrophosphatase
MTDPERVAAIDIGTNSVLLLVAERTGLTPRVISERATITRLGQGVDRTRRLAGEAAQRTLECLADYAQAMRDAHVSRMAVVGTSALRDAHGAQAFLDGAERVLGERPRVISGREEAELSFLGALSGLPLTGPVTVFDVGGGSTELISGVAQPPRFDVTRSNSVNVGSVRLHERHVTSDPPAPEQLARIHADVRAALSELPAPDRALPLVGVAGTVTTLAALHQELASYDGARVHGSRLMREDVLNLTQRLGMLSTAARQILPGLDVKRADVIVAGAIITCEVLSWSGAPELIVSDRGVRWGLVQRLLGLA